ncbi:MAG: winged helix-turn-helix transcriptional regulator [Bacteriovoracaceae bacterium]|nr:winged helix-turn-helix transcriptional regulator [Bacteriovoracaceae bacterium]
MNKIEKFKKKAEILKAMAHSTRLIVIDALKKGEKCVCELNDLVNADQSTLSRHLSVLKNAGIITDDKRGQNVFYKLRCPCVLDYIDCIEKVIKNR